MRQARLTSDRMTSTITAPMVALMMSRVVPLPRLTPSCGNSQPATSAPMMPITMLPISPKSRAAHDQAGQPAGDRADHQCCDDTHGNPPLKNALSGSNSSGKTGLV